MGVFGLGCLVSQGFWGDRWIGFFIYLFDSLGGRFLLFLYFASASLSTSSGLATSPPYPGYLF